MSSESSFYPVGIHAAGVHLHGELTIPPSPVATVAILHDSSCGRLATGSRYAAMRLASRRIASLVVDVITMDEHYEADNLGIGRDDLERPRQRIETVLDWLRADPIVGRLPVGLFAYGPGNCGAASLMVAADRPDAISAIVIRCGRPDRAGRALGQPLPPTLLIVGGDDVLIQRQNKDAFRRLRTRDKHLEFVDGASNGFPELGKFDEATALAVDWFVSYGACEACRAEKAVALH